MNHLFTALITFRNGKQKQEFSNSKQRLLSFIMSDSVKKVEIFVNSKVLIKLYTATNEKP